MTDPLSDTMRMIDNWEQDAAEKARRFEAMSERVERISITESVAGGAVSATVGHNGIPTDVTMTDGVRDMAPKEIAANVMAAIRRAQSRYPERLGEILADTVGTDDPAARHILATAEANFPAPEDRTTDALAGEPMRFSDVEEEPAPARPVRRPPTGNAPGGNDDDGDDVNDVRVFRE
jgi:DNA-binding protein YbaB